MTLDQFEDGCPTEKDLIRVNGSLNLKGSNPAKFFNIAVIDSRGRTIATRPISDCTAGGYDLKCTKINSTYFNVILEHRAQKELSEKNVKLRTFNDLIPIDGGTSVPYPVVKDAIIETFEVNNTVVPLDSDKVTFVTEGNIGVLYNVSGVSLPRLSAVRILDSLYNVLAESYTSNEVSTNIEINQINAIYVSYNTSNGCFSGTKGLIKVCFTELPTPDLTFDVGGKASTGNQTLFEVVALCHVTGGYLGVDKVTLDCPYRTVTTQGTDASLKLYISTFDQVLCVCSYTHVHGCHVKTFSSTFTLPDDVSGCSFREESLWWPVGLIVAGILYV